VENNLTSALDDERKKDPAQQKGITIRLQKPPQFMWEFQRSPVPYEWDLIKGVYLELTSFLW
jgi:hypothetical protein